MSERQTITLKHPIQWGEQELITELKVRRPKAKDFRSLPAKPAFGDIMDMAAKVCDQPKTVIDELDLEDLNTLMDIVGGFLPGSLATGERR